MKLRELLKLANEKKASDLHLLVGKSPILRIDGELKEFNEIPKLDSTKLKEEIFSILTDRQKEKFIQERELDTSLEIDDLARFRINIYWEKDNPALAARVISPILPTMEEILMPQLTHDFTRLLNGLIIVTGPAGCGKSTTLAAMINLINHERACNIITLEDPIEFVFKPIKSIISQRQLGTDITSFTKGLKHILRQDPNIIMVGEMRDLETIATTLTLAETGHLVLTTLHTQDAAQTIDRIIDVFPSNQQRQIGLQLSISLRGIISQRLLSKRGGGRIAAREILVNTPAVANLVRESKIAQIKNIIQTSAERGMHTLDQDVKRLYKQKFITKEIAGVYLGEYGEKD